LRGVKAEIDAIVWYGGNVQHSLTDSGGYTTSLQLENKLPEDTVDTLYEEPKANPYTGVVAFYRDKGTGKENSVIAGGSRTPKRIRRVYDSKEGAQRAAESEWVRLQGRRMKTTPQVKT
jgi:phage protein D